MRIGLTGATGVLGQSVQRDWPGVSWHAFRGDVRDAAAVRTWADTDLDAVLHLAAIVPVGRVTSDPGAAFEVNVRGTWNVLLALQGRGIWTFVASSSHVHGVSLYGVTKRLAEAAALGLGPACVGRIFSFSSPTQDPSYLLPGLLRRIDAADRGSTLVVSGGHNVRDFLTTRKIVDAIRVLHEHRVTGVVDIGSGEGVSVLDVARRLAARKGREDLRIVTEDEERTVLVAEPSRLHELGWNGRGAFEELLEEMAS
jgi:nucleoside-diphosphate-sugar epimerase